jgi:hypothetical protein
LVVFSFVSFVRPQFLPLLSTEEETIERKKQLKERRKEEGRKEGKETMFQYFNVMER